MALLCPRINIFISSKDRRICKCHLSDPALLLNDTVRGGDHHNEHAHHDFVDWTPAAWAYLNHGADGCVSHLVLILVAAAREACACAGWTTQPWLYTSTPRGVCALLLHVTAYLLSAPMKSHVGQIIACHSYYV